MNVVGVFDGVWIVHSGSRRSQIGSGVWIRWHFHCSSGSRVFVNDGFGGGVCSALSVQCGVAL